MSGVPLTAIATHLDALLRVREVPDYPPALNGVQVEHRGPVTRIAAAVDTSARTIRGAVDAGANLLLVHHGLFWSGLQPLTGQHYSRVRLLLDHDVALYSAHLPLDTHPTFGNSLLLSREIGLQASAGFARHETIDCGVRGTSDIATAELVSRLNSFATLHGGAAVASASTPGRRTRHWAICSGAGVSVDTLREAADLGVDTLISGEGPHWSAVDAEERGLVIVYAGHYATETLGVRALAEHLSATFSVPWTFIAAPTGL
ncbi:MAG: Nif3-like dinuclear metal center hexameric protein [Gemmatimonadales bacterium]